MASVVTGEAERGACLSLLTQLDSGVLVLALHVGEWFKGGEMSNRTFMPQVADSKEVGSLIGLSYRGPVGKQLPNGSVGTCQSCFKLQTDT